MADAASCSRPPSEKESGVTFTTPITTGSRGTAGIVRGYEAAVAEHSLKAPTVDIAYVRTRS
jgi:hypothetical protein